MVLLLPAVLLAGCGAQDKSGSGEAVVRTPQVDRHGLKGSPVDPPFTMPRTTLTDTDGNQFNLVTSTKKPVTLVFFGYTHCPDVCNTVLADVASALTKLDDEVRDQVQLVFVTTDPARDDGPAIRKYLDRFDESFVGLTGDLRGIEKMARSLGIAMAGMKRLPSGGYEVSHGAQVIGFGTDDRAPVFWQYETAIGDLKHDFEKLVERNR
jgi:protein SCO1